MTIKDDGAQITCTGRCDDGSDQSIAIPQLAESSVLNGVGKFRPIKPVKVQVAFKTNDSTQRFTASREWVVPRLILGLSAGPLALLNVAFLVTDAQLADEDLLIGLPVLKHLEIDSKTMLERNRDCLLYTSPSPRDQRGSRMPSSA